MCKHHASGTFIYRKKKKKNLNLAILLPKTQRHATVNQNRINTTVFLQYCFNVVLYGNTKIIQGLLNIQYTYVDNNFLLELYYWMADLYTERNNCSNQPYLVSSSSKTYDFEDNLTRH